jgi:hypothetical protein
MAQDEEEDSYLECGCCGLIMSVEVDHSFDESNNKEFCDVKQGWLEIYAKHQVFENLLYLCPTCAKQVAIALKSDKETKQEIK